MTFVPRKKATLLIPSGDKKHLFAILTDNSDDGCHLLVNFATIHKDRFHDNACVVNAGEHPFIKHPSYVEYRLARIDTSQHLIKCVTGWEFIQNTPITDRLFDRMVAGIMISEHTPRRIKDYYQNIN